MPKLNKFSGMQEPDKDTCTSASDDNIVRFRQAQLKLDRISHGHEEDIAFDLVTLAKKYNKAGISISFDLDYWDAMAVLEEIYNDVDANMMIGALEAIATNYGYTSDMDATIFDRLQEAELKKKTF